jgi:hypothetical protein
MIYNASAHDPRKSGRKLKQAVEFDHDLQYIQLYLKM